jgi:hypothetical protein
MHDNPPILALSDLSSGSDAAVQLAGAFALLFETQLHVLHAMGLTHRPLRTVMPALQNLNAAMQRADGALRTQLRRVTPQLAGAAVPIIDLDEPLIALQRRGSTTRPRLVCSGPLQGWSDAWLRSMPAPVLSVHEARRKVFNRAVVICHPDFIDEGVIETTGRWSHMLTRIYGNLDIRPPQFDVLLLDGSLNARSIFGHVEENPADIIAVHAESVLEAESSALRELMPALLARSTTPLLLLTSRMRWGGDGGGVRTVQNTAA